MVRGVDSSAECTLRRAGTSGARRATRSCRERRRREGEGDVGPASLSAGGSRHPSSRAASGCHCSQMCSATHRLRRPSASLHLSGGCCSGRRSVGSTQGTRWFDTGGPALELSPLIHQPTRPSVRTRRRVPSRLSTNRPCCWPPHAATHRPAPPHARRMRPHPGKRMASQMGTDRVGHAPTSAIRSGAVACVSGPRRAQTKGNVTPTTKPDKGSSVNLQGHRPPFLSVLRSFRRLSLIW